MLLYDLLLLRSHPFLLCGELLDVAPHASKVRRHRLKLLNFGRGLRG